MRRYVDEEILPFAFEWESEGVVPDSARDNPTVFHYLVLAIVDPGDV